MCGQKVHYQCILLREIKVWRSSGNNENLILVILNDRQSIGLPVVFYYPYFTEIDLEVCYQRKILTVNLFVGWYVIYL